MFKEVLELGCGTDKNTKWLAGKARSVYGISISYWKGLESIKKWKENSEYLLAQKREKKEWYKTYKIRISKVERDYDFST